MFLEASGIQLFPAIATWTSSRRLLATTNLNYNHSTKISRIREDCSGRDVPP